MKCDAVAALLARQGVVAKYIKNVLACGAGYGLWCDWATKHPFDCQAEIHWGQPSASVVVGDALKEGCCSRETEVV